ncbi:hypothetical protein Tco_0818762 [Tanacetum coccineum]
MDDDLFTYEVEVANIPCDSKMDDDSKQEVDDDMGYDPSDVAFIEWLGSKNFNYKTMNHYTMKALWIYWIRGDNEVELTDKESSDDEDDVAKVFRIDTNIFDYETPLYSAFKEFNYLLEGDHFVGTTRAMIDVYNKKITLRMGMMNEIFDVDQSIKRPTTKDDEYYRIDDLDDMINEEAQELLQMKSLIHFYQGD